MAGRALPGYPDGRCTFCPLSCSENMGRDTLVNPRQKRPRIIPAMPQPSAWWEEVRVLGEAGDEVAVELWRALRAARMWTETPPGRRSELLSPLGEGVRERIGQACARAPGIIEALGTFTALLQSPLRMDRRRLSEACHHVHEWADTRGMLSLALLFAEAAAAVDPDDPAPANFAARMCRRVVLEERAGSWYQRAYGLAVRARNRKEAIYALLGYGALLKDLGRHEEARRIYDQAARAAKRTRRLREASEAQHDLLCIAAEVGDYREAERRARLALGMYPKSHPRFPFLLHDFAFVLIRHHYFSAALALLGELTAVIDLPGDQVLLFGTLGRAAGGAQNHGRFEEARQVVERLAEAHEEFAAAALVNLAEGARSFGEWDQAERYAALAHEVARRRRDTLLEKDAADLLQRITTRVPGPAEEQAPHPERLQALVLRFTAKLRKCKAPSRARVGADSGLPPGDGSQCPEPKV